MYGHTCKGHFVSGAQQMTKYSWIVLHRTCIDQLTDLHFSLSFTICKPAPTVKLMVYSCCAMLSVNICCPVVYKQQLFCCL